MKTFITRLILILALFPFSAYIFQNIAHFYIESSAKKQLEQDLNNLVQIVSTENVLSTDIIDSDSMYARYVNNVLRKSETIDCKYDVEVNSSNDITNNTSLFTTSYTGPNGSLNPIKISKIEGGIETPISTYIDCPQRMTLVRVSLTMNVYKKCFIKTFFVTSDAYSQTYSRRLNKITMSKDVIVTQFYKGK